MKNINKISYTIVFIATNMFVLVACTADVANIKIENQAESVSQENRLETTSSYLLAAVAQQRGELELASKAYLHTFGMDSSNTELRDKALSYALAKGDMDTAVRLAKTLSRKDDPGALVWLLLVGDAVKNKQYKKALMFVGWAEDSIQPLLHFRVLESYIKFSMGRDAKELLKEFDDFEEHEALAARKIYYKARIQNRMGFKAEALKSLKKSQHMESGALFTTLALGEDLERKGEIAKASAIYNAFNSANPQAVLLRDIFDSNQLNKTTFFAEGNTMEKDVAEVMFGFGMLMWAQHLDLPARQLLNMALWMDSHSLYQFYAGMVDEQADRLEDAVERYTNVVPEDVSWLSSQLRLVEVFYKLGDVEKSEEIIKKLLIVYPEKIELQSSLADFYYKENRYSEAIKAYDKLFQLLENPVAPQHVRLYFARGASYERLAQYDKASADLEKALEMQPESPTILNYLGYMWIENDMHIDRAFSMISKAAILNPNDAAIMDSLGWGYYKKGQYAKALLYLERAVKLNDEDSTMLEHLGDIHLKLGDEEKARKFWQKSWEVGPAGEREKDRLSKKLEIL